MDTGRYLNSDETVNLSTGATLEAHLERLKALFDDGVITSFPVTRILSRDLTHINGLINDAIGEASTPGFKEPSSSTPNILDVMAKAKAIAETATVSGSLAGAVSANPNRADIHALFELLNNIKEAGTDTSDNQRFIYGGHAYTIIGVEIKNDSGVRLSPDKADVDRAALSIATDVDSEKSTVTLRNPHKGNVPTSGTLESDPGKGTFKITLAQFFRNFSNFDYGRVRKTGV